MLTPVRNNMYTRAVILILPTFVGRRQRETYLIKDVVPTTVDVDIEVESGAAKYNDRFTTHMGVTASLPQSFSAQSVVCDKPADAV